MSLAAGNTRTTAPRQSRHRDDRDCTVLGGDNQNARVRPYVIGLLTLARLRRYRLGDSLVPGGIANEVANSVGTFV